MKNFSMNMRFELVLLVVLAGPAAGQNSDVRLKELVHIEQAAPLHGG